MALDLDSYRVYLERMQTGISSGDNESPPVSHTIRSKRIVSQRNHHNVIPRLCVSACLLFWAVLILHYFQWNLTHSSLDRGTLSHPQLTQVLVPLLSNILDVGNFPLPSQRRAMDWMIMQLPRTPQEEADVYNLIQRAAQERKDKVVSDEETRTRKQESWLLEAFAISSMMSEWGVSPQELESASMPPLKDKQVPTFVSRLCTKTPFLGCDDNGSITRLDVTLIVSSFQGTIPMELSLLTELKEVNLGQDGLTGSLPKEVMGAWTSLERLGIHFASNLQGPLPEALSPTLTSLIIQESPGIEVSQSFLSRFSNLVYVEGIEHNKPNKDSSKEGIQKWWKDRRSLKVWTSVESSIHTT